MKQFPDATEPAAPNMLVAYIKLPEPVFEIVGDVTPETVTPWHLLLKDHLRETLTDPWAKANNYIANYTLPDSDKPRDVPEEIETRFSIQIPFDTMAMINALMHDLAEDEFFGSF